MRRSVKRHFARLRTTNSGAAGYALALARRQPARKSSARFVFEGIPMRVSLVRSNDLAKGSYRAANGEVYAVWHGKRLIELPSPGLSAAADKALVRRSRRS